jgi:hypothetical protein
MPGLVDATSPHGPNERDPADADRGKVPGLALLMEG